MNYRVLLQKSEEGYSVSCPDLPGCWSQGETEKEALANIKDAIAGYLACKLTANTDKVWQEQGLTDERKDAWLKEPS